METEKRRAMAETGKILVDKYEIIEEIAQGGMSRVYRAIDKRLKKPWAIKEINLETKGIHQEVFEQSIMKEMELLKGLDHQALPRIIDIIKEENYIYIVIDYIDGETLGDRLKKQGAQPQETVIEWALQLCQVLTYLHSRTPQVIYRDIKPSNIMINREGKLKLIDFGAARETKEENEEDTTYLGTKGYAPPEQFGGNGQTDPRTDIYSLGVTLYHLVTGKNPCHPPYEIYPIRKWNSSLSIGLEEIIKKCVQLSPNKRFQTCEELEYALLHYKEADKREKRKKRYFLAVLISGVMIGTVGGIGSIIGNNLEISWLFFLGDVISVMLFFLTVILFFVWNMKDAFFSEKGMEEAKKAEQEKDAEAFYKPKDREEIFRVIEEFVLVHTEEEIG